MIQIELPCCGTATQMEWTANEVDCDTCGVVLELVDPAPEPLALAA